ncbi:hypothetical protein I204_02198 [Kwoniella mangroviensis CBS 8886]|uniref:hypothetical protein n=1 Tax=Kwoniella mangroviensis CBS 8507 TaxID=1296122 RepID=UPI00080D426D|nr:uncharacterized protein I203_02435 [Kwoniella mangroviensis CBS 8507]OCF69039.1 hypothetical protein I203_02435 [Kwoniella mangroviensis CBS 8507]OCF76502.1 hypothetical protein I204_02198 [Kwoniella mangroviensis CBS 8886]
MQSILHPIIGPAGPESKDLTGTVSVITGGALGIGFEVARFFALYGGHVIMVNRKEEQGEKAIKDIEAQVKEKGSKGSVEWLGCDLGELKQVKEVFGGLAKRLDRLDYLICSSGINSNQFGLDADGIDRHFGVNALGHYYVINLLYPLLRKTTKLPGVEKGSVRIVFESSEMHRFAPGSEDSVSRGRGCHFGSEEEITEAGKELGPIELYGRTKLAMILYSKAIRDKVIKKNGDDIYILAVHPGAVNTDMQEQWEAAYPGIIGKITKYLTMAGGRDPEQGSYSALYAALSKEVVEKDWNGVYLSDPATLGKETAQGSDLNLATSLWELSERMVKRILGEDALESWSK